MKLLILLNIIKSIISKLLFFMQYLNINQIIKINKNKNSITKLK